MLVADVIRSLVVKSGKIKVFSDWVCQSSSIRMIVYAYYR